jgi:hypothetical protein
VSKQIAVATLEDTSKEKDLLKDGKTWLKGLDCNGGKNRQWPEKS